MFFIYKKLKRTFISLGTGILFYLLTLLPKKIFSGFLALTGYFFLIKFRKIGIFNLKIKFNKGCKKILWRNFRHMSFSAFEFVQLKEKEVFGSVKVKNYEIFAKALSRKKGILVLTLHLGLWEIIPIYFASLKYPVSVLVSTVYTKNIDNLINSLRSKWGTKPIHRENTFSLVRALRKDECVGILMDHNFGTRKEEIEFFGKKTYAPTGPLEILYRTDASPLLMATYRKYNGGKYTHIIEIKAPIITKNLKLDLKHIMSQFEKWITEHPEEWTWIHDRFASVKRKRK